MDKPEVSNAEEIRKIIKVRNNNLGWRKINDFITWLNPGGLRASLWGPMTQDILADARHALGWGIIDEFIKSEPSSSR